MDILSFISILVVTAVTGYLVNKWHLTKTAKDEFATLLSNLRLEIDADRLKLAATLNSHEAAIKKLANDVVANAVAKGGGFISKLREAEQNRKP